tara:strand:+ start:478 stop:1131 length:654 start_codon:yes stop_codon:yes gene_type:complete
MKKTLKILSLFVLTSIFIISCDNKKNDKESKKEEKKESKKEEKKDSKIDKDIKKAGDAMCEMATIYINYQDAMQNQNMQDVEKYEKEANEQQELLEEIKDMLKENYARGSKDYEKAKKLFFNELGNCKEELEKLGIWSTRETEFDWDPEEEAEIIYTEEPELEDNEYEGDEYYDEDEYYEEEGEGVGIPGGDIERYMELLEEGYSNEDAIKIMEDEY